jgi:hypothetical protein
VLTIDEAEELLRVARRWPPELMVRRGLFRPDNKSQFCADTCNRRVTITTKETKTDLTTKTVAETTRTLNVMYFRPQWVREYFKEASEKAEQELVSRWFDELNPDQKAIAKLLSTQGAVMEHLVALIGKRKDVFSLWASKRDYPQPPRSSCSDCRSSLPGKC